MKFQLLSKENLWAVIFCIILIALVILTVSSAPIWIYQGF